MESFMGDLSACETMIMKVIWDAKEDIALQLLLPQKLKDQWVMKTQGAINAISFKECIIL